MSSPHNAGIIVVCVSVFVLCIVCSIAPPPLYLCFAACHIHTSCFDHIECVCTKMLSSCVYVCVHKWGIHSVTVYFLYSIQNPVSFARGSLIVHWIHFVHTHLFVRCVVSFSLLTCVLSSVCFIFYSNIPTFLFENQSSSTTTTTTNYLHKKNSSEYFTVSFPKPQVTIC